MPDVVLVKPSIFRNDREHFLGTWVASTFAQDV
jgi:hypothetical protein